MKTQKIIYLLMVFSAIVASCNNKTPFHPDYEIGVGVIIGRENCSSVPSKNAWLIQLIRPSYGGRTFGDEITYDNVKYSNVVKTNNLPDTSKIPEKTYAFEFYIEKNAINQKCDTQNPITFDVQNIRVQNFGGVKLID